MALTRPSGLLAAVLPDPGRATLDDVDRSEDVVPDDPRWGRLVAEFRAQQLDAPERSRWVRVLGLTVALPALVVVMLVLGLVIVIGGNELLPEAQAPEGSPANALQAAVAACDDPGGHVRTVGSRVVSLDRVGDGLEFQCTYVLFQWPHYGGLIRCERGEWIGPNANGMGREVGVPCGVQRWPPPLPAYVDCTLVPSPCEMPKP